MKVAVWSNMFQKLNSLQVLKNKNSLLSFKLSNYQFNMWILLNWASSLNLHCGLLYCSYQHIFIILVKILLLLYIKIRPFFHSGHFGSKSWLNFGVLLCIPEFYSSKSQKAALVTVLRKVLLLVPATKGKVLSSWLQFKRSGKLWCKINP